MILIVSWWEILKVWMPWIWFRLNRIWVQYQEWIGAVTLPSQSKFKQPYSLCDLDSSMQYWNPLQSSSHMIFEILISTTKNILSTFHNRRFPNRFVKNYKPFISSAKQKQEMVTKGSSHMSRAAIYIYIAITQDGWLPIITDVEPIALSMCDFSITRVS